MKCLLVAALLLMANPLPAADSFPRGSHGMLAQLQGFMHNRGTEIEELTPRDAVQLMVDWYRLGSATPGANAGDDALVFRYGGWSEGCATAFNLSLLRRVKNEGDADGVAGITLMFEPSSQSEIVPFSTASSDWKSLDAFLQAVEGAPAFRLLAAAKPMSVLIEGGGLR